MAGEHLTKPPYGCKVAPNDKKKWIFDLCAAGNEPMRIAKILKADNVFNFVGEIHLPTDPQTERKATNEQEKTA